MHSAVSVHDDQRAGRAEQTEEWRSWPSTSAHDPSLTIENAIRPQFVSARDPVHHLPGGLPKLRHNNEVALRRAALLSYQLPRGLGQAGQQSLPFL